MSGAWRLRGARCLVAGLAALLWSAASPAAPASCPPPTPTLDEASLRALQAQARDRGLLWRVEKDGRVAWLYGTIHVGQPAWIVPGPQVLAALREADSLALEIDPLDEAIGERLRQRMVARPGEPRLPAPLAARLARQTRAACVGDALAGLLPEMQAVTLVALAGRRIGLDPAFGVDAMLAGLARRLGKPVRSLETPEEQLDALLSAEPREAQRQVDALLRELETGRALPVMRRLAGDWADSRIDDLDRYGEWCDCLNIAAQREQHHRLVDARNLRLAERMVARHAGGERVFVAVGALHLTGAQGLPALLAARGFTVQRLLPAAPGG